MIFILWCTTIAVDYLFIYSIHSLIKSYIYVFIHSFIRFKQPSNRINVWTSSIYRTTVCTPSGTVEMYCPFREACCLRHHGIWVTPRRHMPEESDCHDHFRDNLPSHIIHLLFSAFRPSQSQSRIHILWPFQNYISGQSKPRWYHTPNNPMHNKDIKFDDIVTLPGYTEAYSIR
jgi:hypothetical protein